MTRLLLTLLSLFLLTSPQLAGAATPARPANCGERSCGKLPGRDRVDCGACAEGLVCGALQPNVCAAPGCRRESDVELCVREGSPLEVRMVNDGCGFRRDVPCAAPRTKAATGAGEAGDIKLEPGASFALGSLRGSGLRLAGPQLTHEELLAVAGTASNDVWAAGGRGTMLHWDGAAWSHVEVPTAAHLSGLWFAGPADGWAVGGEGTALRWDGARWTKVALPVETALNAVWGAGPGQVWAAGALGVILHWNGEAWSQAERFTWRSFEAVWGRSASEVWAGGRTGLLARFDGERWRQVSLDGVEGIPYGHISALFPVGAGGDLGLLRPPPDYYSEIHGVRLSPVAGASGATGWSVRPLESESPGATDFAGAFVSEAITVKVGHGIVSRAGAKVSTLPFEGEVSPSWRAAWAASGNDAWAVGGSSIARFDGRRWREWGQRFSAEAACGDRQGGLFAVGRSGREPAAMWRSREGRWSALRAPPSGCADTCSVWSAGPDDLWLSGKQLLHWNGKAWRPRPLPGGANALGGWAARRGEAWVASSDGVWRWDGKAWERPSPPGARWHAVGGAGSGKLWAVGEEGAIARFEKGQWQPMPSPTRRTLNAVTYVSDRLAWAAGDDVVLRWDGKAWTTVFESQRYLKLRAVCETGSGGVLAVGVLGDAQGDYWPPGALLEKAGDRWTLTEVPPQLASCVVDEAAVWMAGNGMLYVRPASAVKASPEPGAPAP